VLFRPFRVHGSGPLQERQAPRLPLAHVLLNEDRRDATSSS
jgi:hypothetical protein